ncbi:hypothetical protein EV714DRAFT_170969, partial [Schizophyllum commune]
MDNASNCDTTATSLQRRLPRYKGASWRLRCLLHIVNLIAKVRIRIQLFSCDAQAVEAFFRKQYKRKPKSLGAADAAAEEMFILENGDELTAEEQDVAQAAEADAAEESHGIPVAQLVKDKAAVKTMKEQAIDDMKQRGIYLSDQEQKMALGVLPKITGLARRLNDSPASLKPPWDASLALKADELPHNLDMLSRCVATRWNSTNRCVGDHIALKPAVVDFTNKPELKLKAYRLTPDQWDLSQDFHELLKVFVPITETFSKKETPLVADSLTALDRLRRSLVKCRDHATAPNIIRVAAHAGVLMADKYFALMDECEVYYIAIALSPHYKLQWFRDRGWTEPQVLKVWERLITRW